MDFSNPGKLIVELLISATLLLLTVWVISNTARRVLGVQVGAFRAFLVSFLVVLSAIGVIPAALGGLIATVDYSQHWLQFDLLILLIALWTFAIGALVLVVSEILLPTGSLPPVQDIIFGSRERWRRARRYLALMRIFTKYGLRTRFFTRNPTADQERNAAIALRRAFDEAGVTFVKLGQMLSTRSDLLAPVFVEELSKLQTTASAETWQTINAALTKTYRRDLSEIFSWIDPTPMAAASVAQVHRAVLVDGPVKNVVIKVQRPGAVSQVNLDLGILLTLAKRLERSIPQARAIGVAKLAAGFADQLTEELDYEIEMDNMAAMAATVDSRIRVPQLISQYSTRRVIVMEELTGTPISNAEQALAGLSDDLREAAADVLLESVIDQIMHDGIFHADLHPGNVIIWPDAKLGLLDYGAVGRLDSVSRRNLALLLWAINADDPATVIDAMLELLDHQGSINDRQLQRDIGVIITRVRAGLSANATMSLFTQLLDIAVDHGFIVPRTIAAAMRSLAALEGTLKIICPSYNMLGTAVSRTSAQLGQFNHESLRQEIDRRLLRIVPLLEHLPRRLDKITQQLETGQLVTKIRLFSSEVERGFVSELTAQLVSSMLSGSAVLAGVVLIISPHGPALMPGVSAYNFLGYLLAFAGFVLALRNVAKIFGRPHE